MTTTYDDIRRTMTTYDDYNNNNNNNNNTVICTDIKCVKKTLEHKNPLHYKIVTYQF